MDAFYFPRGNSWRPPGFVEFVNRQPPPPTMHSLRLAPRLLYASTNTVARRTPIISRVALSVCRVPATRAFSVSGARFEPATSEKSTTKKATTKKSTAKKAPVKKAAAKKTKKPKVKVAKKKVVKPKKKAIPKKPTVPST